MMFKFSLLICLLTSFTNSAISQETIEQKPYKTFNKLEGGILSLAFQPDNKSIVVGMDNKKCIFLSIPEGKEIFSFSGLINNPKAIAYTPDSKYLLMAVERGIRIYYPNGEFVNQHGGPATFVWSFSFNPLTNKVAFGSYDKNIRIIDFTTGKLTTVSGHTKNALAVKYSPDNKLLASGSLDETVRLWDADSYNPIYTFTGHGGNVYDLVFTPDSKKLISASNDNTIRIWDIESQKYERSLLGNSKAVLCLAISPDGYYLVSGSFDGNVMLWDILRGESIYTFQLHTDVVNAVAFSSDGKFIASGSSDKSVSIWKIEPELFVQKYYSENFKEELEKSELFLPKKKEEPKDTFKVRVEKGIVFKNELISKYYNKYVEEIKGNPVK